MRRRRRIGEAPAWQRRLILIVTALFGATLLLFAAWAVILFGDGRSVDECLDKGGSYDHELGACDLRQQDDTP